MANATNYTKGKYNYYRVVATVGYDAKGKPIRKEFLGKGKKEAQKKKDEYVKNNPPYLNTDIAFMKLGDAIHTYLFQYKKISGNVRTSSFNRYECVYRLYIKSSPLANKTVTSVKSLDVLKFINDLHVNYQKSHSLLKTILKVLKMFFTWADLHDAIMKNPCKSIVVPGKSGNKEKEVSVFTQDELDKIKTELDKMEARGEFNLKLIVKFALGTGMRRGEILALRYDDIIGDKANVRMSLNDVTDVKEDGTRSRSIDFVDVKSKTSYRTVTLPEDLQKAIKKHRINQLQNVIAVGLGQNPEYLFTTKTGKLLDPSNVTTAFRRMLKRGGVDHKKFHALRHTYATKMACERIPLHTISELLGHSNIAMTMIYSHSDDQSKQEAAIVANSLLI